MVSKILKTDNSHSIDEIVGDNIFLIEKPADIYKLNMCIFTVTSQGYCLQKLLLNSVISVC